MTLLGQQKELKFFSLQFPELGLGLGLLQVVL